MNSIPNDDGYRVDADTSDILETQHSQARYRLQGMQGQRAQVQNKHDAATVLREAAKRALAKPLGPGMPYNAHVIPTQDLREAESVLAKCAEELRQIDDGISRVQAQIAQIEEKKKSLNQDAIRARRELDALRGRMRGEKVSAR